MTEAELQSAVIELARLLDWKCAHFRTAQVGGRWQTPVQGDGAGFPDLVLARRGIVAFVELKSAKGKLRPEQQAWLDVLCGAWVWRPEDWTDGSIERYLRDPWAWPGKWLAKR